MTAAATGSDILKEQRDATNKRLSLLGYIWTMPDRMNSAGQNNGIDIFHQLGDSSRRIVWRTKDVPPTLAVETFAGPQSGWIEKARVRLQEFADAALVPDFIGTVSGTMRMAATKLGATSQGGFGFFFSRPQDGAATQVLFAVRHHGLTSFIGTPQRVRVAPRLSGDAVLVFEDKSWDRNAFWRHLFGTTASWLLKPSPRRDMALEADFGGSPPFPLSKIASSVGQALARAPAPALQFG